VEEREEDVGGEDGAEFFDEAEEEVGEGLTEIVVKRRIRVRSSLNQFVEKCSAQPLAFFFSSNQSLVRNRRVGRNRFSRNDLSHVIIEEIV